MEMCKVGPTALATMTLPNKKYQLKLMARKDQNQPAMGIGNKKAGAPIFKQVNIKHAYNRIKSAKRING